MSGTGFVLTRLRKTIAAVVSRGDYNQNKTKQNKITTTTKKTMDWTLKYSELKEWKHNLEKEI